MKIIICDTCKGSGLEKQENIIDYHHGLLDVNYISCKTCNGYGRLLHEEKTHKINSIEDLKKACK